MKQPVTRELFGYWNALRGSRLAPMRDDIDPGAIRSSLADTFLLTFDVAHGHPFRLAGSSVCGLFGRELKDDAFANLWSSASQPAIVTLLHDISEDKAGAVGRVIGRNCENETLDLEMILLPLIDRTGSTARLLGGFASVGAPYWIGSRAVEAIDLAEVRYVGPTVDPARQPRLIAGHDSPFPAPGFTIYPAHHRPTI